MIWLFLVLLFSFGECVELVSNTEDKLIFTQIIFRHGHRTILKTFADDKFKDRIFWPDGFAQLTNVGKQSEYELGLFLKRRYKQLIGDDGKFEPKKVSVLSSGFDRTINSATVVLSALFPPISNQIWNEQLLWNPIAVHSIPSKVDYLISCDIACRRYVKALNEYQQTPEIKSLINKNQKLFEYLEKNTGQPVRNLDQLKDIQNILSIENSMNFTLPAWARDIMKPGDPFEYLSTYWLKVVTATKEMKRLRSGFLLKDILDRFKNKTLSSPSNNRQVMQIYSGHEITISSMLDSLGIFELHVPPYSSCLMFDLYESSNDTRDSENKRYYVQLFYRNSSTDDLTPMNIPQCGVKCSLNQFYELYNDILASDFIAECQIPNEYSIDKNRANTMYISINVYGVLILFAYYFNV